MLKLSQRRLWILGLIVLGVVIFLTLIAALTSNKMNAGSTYNRSPDGYGAWYAYMSKRGTPVQRWQKPFDELAKKPSPITLLRVNSALNSEEAVLVDKTKNWLKKGNTLVILGISEPVTAAPFSTLQTHSTGQIKIDTRRRKEQPGSSLLSDDYGTIVWTKSIGQGQIIYATTPYLAANAYQDYSGNYQFLAQLVTQKGKSIWVDEYYHGYKDRETLTEEVGDNIWHYFQKTPLWIFAIQGLILLILVLWAGNRRLGKPIPLVTPSVNSSEAYIQGLAEVLHKAQRTEFVISMLTPAEQRQLQKTLGLGETLLEPQALWEAIRQNGYSSTDVESLLTTYMQKRPLSDAALQSWLIKWQQVQNQVQ